jgi:hypothetical protein
MKKKISISDILVKFVFIPQSSVLIINIIRNILKVIFRTFGKIAAIFMLAGIKIKNCTYEKY